LRQAWEFLGKKWGQIREKSGLKRRVLCYGWGVSKTLRVEATTIMWETASWAITLGLAVVCAFIILWSWSALR
jgi:hypothetical protein